jgi:hypothetical protein
MPTRRAPLLAAALLAAACAAPGEAPAPAPAAPAAAAVPAPDAVPAENPAAPAAVPLPPTGNLPGDLVPFFRASVRRPGAEAEEALDSRATRGATVYIVNSPTCPYCQAYAARMRALEAAYMPRRIDVVHVYPNRQETDAEKIAWHGRTGFRGGLVLDAGASIAKALDADRTPTVFLVDARGVVLYRGAIDSDASDRPGTKPHLADALDAHLAGREVPVASTEPEG